MPKQIKLGFTDYTTTVFIPDPASTDGSGKTGLVAANLTVSYTRVEDDNDVTVTDVTSSLNNLAALTSTHNDWGVLEVSSALAPGLYRLDIADAVFASGAWTAVVYVMITTSAAAASPIEFVLVAFNPLDGVHLGLTALPNAAADAAGGLPISDAGGLDLDAKIGALTFTVANKVDSNITHAAGTAWGSGAITNASIANNAINDAKVDPDVTIASVTGAVGSVTAGVIITTNNDKTGYTLSNTGIDNVLDRTAGIETNRTLRQGLRLMLSAMAGMASGLGTTTATYRDTNNTVNRIVATVDTDGNRSAVTLDTS